jgi:carboxyl-terminal processing protease
MRRKQAKFEFLTLLLFLIGGLLVLTNGFTGRIFAQGQDVDVFAKIQPIGEVLDTILNEYVKEPNLDKVVEGALVGMMNSLDRNSSYISPEVLNEMRAETKGEFEGIGVTIHLDDDKNIVIFHPMADSPAAQAGILAGDMIIKIDGTPTLGMAVDEAAKRIRGPRNSVLQLTVLRRDEKGQAEEKEFSIKRGNIPIESVKEARILPSGIGYMRVSDFKENTARDLEKYVKQFLQDGMKGMVLDLRWNPGGLLTASREVAELFLPKNTLVVYTQGRNGAHSTALSEDLRLYTERNPILPPGFPMAILVNGETASSSEIVTGALQFWSRAIVIGEKTYGKGSVQTIIPLAQPQGSALRLTTALYYTPAEVTIDSQGIKPDLEVAMSIAEQRKMFEQMGDSVKDKPGNINELNHGTVTGAPAADGLIEDVQLKRAVEVLAENGNFEQLLAKYHKDTHETQVAASPDKVLRGKNAPDLVTENKQPEKPADQPAPEPAPAQ